LGLQFIVTTGVIDVFCVPNGYPGVNKVLIFLYECIPLVVFGHRYGTRTQLLDRGVGGVTFTLEDAGIGVVGLLYLADDDCF
jgi:hypothetical protein